MIDSRLLEKFPLIADGDVPGLLARAHGSRCGPPESLNLEAPDTVQALHRSFVSAGAVLHRTNTAQGNAAALGFVGLEGRAEAVNNSGAAALRGAVGLQGVMMGALSPLVLRGASLHPGAAVVERAYSEQIVYLSDTGVDLFLLTHCSSVQDALALLRRVKALSDAPALVLLTQFEEERLRDDRDFANSARRLADEGADAIGLACARAVDGTRRRLDMLLASDLPVALFLKATGADGTTPVTAERYASDQREFAARGVSILGGCCGVTAEHVAALARAPE